jgi:tryptophanyl-tRNA synthetase
VPEPYILKSGARIKSLTHPDKKMSKSDEASSYISLLDSTDAILKKFKRAVTDSETEIRYDPENKPGVSNLLEIYADACQVTIQEAAKEFHDKQYGHLKQAAAEAVINNITEPIQARYSELIKNQDHLEQIMKNNAQRAKHMGDEILLRTKKAIGLTV